MTQTEILNLETSKTAKMKMLFELGLTRKEVSELLGVGYGFVQNVYANNYPNRISSRNEFRFIFNREFGVEIEAYGVSKTTLTRELYNEGIATEVEYYNHTLRNHWKIVNDGSLSGNSSFELVSPVLKGEDGLEQIKKVSNVLKRLNAKINKTCGLHIHLNARDLELTDWKNIYKNYIRLEPIIDSIMPNSRKGNNNRYCHSLIQNNYENKINNSNSLQELSRNITGRDRYYKLNTESYWRHKTVEFRQHSGTIEYEKISNWILFLTRFVEYSRKKEIMVEDAKFEKLNKFLDNDIIEYLKDRRNKNQAA